MGLRKWLWTHKRWAITTGITTVGAYATLVSAGIISKPGPWWPEMTWTSVLAIMMWLFPVGIAIVLELRLRRKIRRLSSQLFRYESGSPFSMLHGELTGCRAGPNWVAFDITVHNLDPVKGVRIRPDIVNVYQPGIAIQAHFVDPEVKCLQPGYRCHFEVLARGMKSETPTVLQKFSVHSQLMVSRAVDGAPWFPWTVKAENVCLPVFYENRLV